MNLADLRARTRQLSGAELDGLRSDQEIDVLIQEAYRSIGQLDTWKWREAIAQFLTVVAVPEYTLPEAIDKIQGLSILDAQDQTLPVPLRETALRDLLTRIRRDDEQLPLWYARQGERLVRLGPTPDKAYTVEVFGQAPLSNLVGDNDSPEWDARFHAPIAYLASSVFLAEEGQEELSEARGLEAQAQITEMVNFYQVSKDVTPVVMGGGQTMSPEHRLGRLWSWRR